MKRCIVCGTEKSLTEFHERRKNRSKNGQPYLYIYVPNECASCEHKKRGNYRQTPEGRASDRRAHKKYYETHKDEILARGKSEARREIHRRYNRSASGKARQAKYESTVEGRANLESRRARHRQVRTEAVEATTGRKLTARAWRTILRAYEHHCAYCDRDLTSEPDLLTQDHVIPLTKGGQHRKDNVVPACKPCNDAKGDAEGWVPRPPKRTVKF